MRSGFARPQRTPRKGPLGRAARRADKKERSRRPDFSLYRGPQTRRPLWRRILRALVLLFVVYQIVQMLVLQSYVVQSGSMQPTLEAGDRVLALPALYGPVVPAIRRRLPGIAEPERGDVVLVQPPYYEHPGVIRAAADPIVRFITGQRVSLVGGSEDVWRSALVVKRLIGLPGDVIRYEEDRVYLVPARTQPQGEPRSKFQLADREYEIKLEELPEAFGPQLPFGRTMEALVLNDNEYFVAGDNRTRSLDSRHWGVVTSQALRTRVVLRYFPVGRWGFL